MHLQYMVEINFTYFLKTKSVGKLHLNVLKSPSYFHIVLYMYYNNSVYKDDSCKIRKLNSDSQDCYLKLFLECIEKFCE